MINWNEPSESNDLRHYTIFSCISNTSNRSRCSDFSRIEADEVPTDHTYYKSLRVSNDSYIWAISAIYDQGAGDMVWYNHTHLVQLKPSLHGIEGVVALLFLGVFVYVLIQKFKFMAGIRVELPPGVLSARYDTKDSDQYEMLSIPASFSPTILLPDNTSTDYLAPTLAGTSSTSLPGSELPGTVLEDAALPSTPLHPLPDTTTYVLQGTVALPASPVGPLASVGAHQAKVPIQSISNGYVSMQQVMPVSSSTFNPSEYVRPNMEHTKNRNIVL